MDPQQRRAPTGTRRGRQAVGAEQPQQRIRRPLPAPHPRVRVQLPAAQHRVLEEGGQHRQQPQAHGVGQVGGGELRSEEQAARHGEGGGGQQERSVHPPHDERQEGHIEVPVADVGELVQHHRPERVPVPREQRQQSAAQHHPPPPHVTEGEGVDPGLEGFGQERDPPVQSGRPGQLVQRGRQFRHARQLPVSAPAAPPGGQAGVDAADDQEQKDGRSGGDRPPRARPRVVAVEDERRHLAARTRVARAGRVLCRTDRALVVRQHLLRLDRGEEHRRHAIDQRCRRRRHRGDQQHETRGGAGGEAERTAPGPRRAAG